MGGEDGFCICNQYLVVFWLVYPLTSVRGSKSVRVIFDRAFGRPYHAPAMANPLRDRVTPQLLADREQSIEINGKIADLERLVEIIAGDLEGLSAARRPKGWRDTPVEVSLAFDWLDRENDLPAVKGRISTKIAAVCQRCLEGFALPVDTKVKLVFAAEDSPSPAGFETWEMAEETFRPLDVVEEALIMALPLSPKHDNVADCGPLAGTLASENEKPVRPFADLRSQMEQAKK